MQSDPGRIVGVENFFIDIQMYQRIWNGYTIRAGGNFAEACCDGQHGIAVLEAFGCCRHRIAAEAHAGMQQMVRRKHAQALQGRGNRRSQPFGQFGQLLRRMARTPACKYSRMFCGDEQLCGLINIVRIQLRQCVAMCFGAIRFRLGDFCTEHGDIDRHFNHDRAGFAAGGDVIRLIDRRHNLFMPGDFESGLGDGFQQGVLLHVVQLIGLAIGTHAAGDDQHGYAVQCGFTDAAGGMRHSGSRNDHQSADMVRGAADRIGHE